MSQNAVKAFYRKLESDPVLRREALSLKECFDNQEEVINAFIRLGAQHGLQFTPSDLVQYIFTCGQEEK